MVMSEPIPNDAPSSYMRFLPAFMQEGESNGKANLLGRFLKIFEKLLSGLEDEVRLEVPTPEGRPQHHDVVGIEQILDKIHDYFDPLFTPSFLDTDQSISDFIHYLSAWVALVQNQTWDVKSQRRLLREIVPLYKKRATEAGLSQYLQIFLKEFEGAEVIVQEFLEGIQVGVRATIGQDTVVGGSPPYFFFVRISLQQITGTLPLVNLVFNTRAILDLEKPAHTYYAILYNLPGMEVGIRSSVSENTLIGSPFGIFA
jgi:phage tail-like protein